MNTRTISIRTMTRDDISMGMRLKSLAGWNQQETDWEFLIDAGGQGNFVCELNGTGVGTVTTITYENRFSWIGMVLVDPEHRGLGIGSMLLKHAIDFAGDKGAIRLDATPRGKPLYEKLGFRVEREWVRMECKPGESLPDPAAECKPLTAETLQEVIAWDTTVFGAGRGSVLDHLLTVAPAYARIRRVNGNIRGYCMGRPGSDFEQIGPLVAEDRESAQSLLLSALQHCHDKPVIIDVFRENQPWLDFLSTLGFRIQRPLTRMYRGTLEYPGKPDRQYALAGPELG